jgi:hypothetical protein
MDMERTMQQMLQQLLAMQEKADANRKADLEEMKADEIADRECIKTKIEKETKKISSGR